MDNTSPCLALTFPSNSKAKHHGKTVPTKATNDKRHLTHILGYKTIQVHIYIYVTQTTIPSWNFATKAGNLVLKLENPYLEAKKSY